MCACVRIRFRCETELWRVEFLIFLYETLPWNEREKTRISRVQATTPSSEAGEKKKRTARFDSNSARHHGQNCLTYEWLVRHCVSNVLRWAGETSCKETSNFVFRDADLSKNEQGLNARLLNSLSYWSQAQRRRSQEQKTDTSQRLRLHRGREQRRSRPERREIPDYAYGLLCFRGCESFSKTSIMQRRSFGELPRCKKLLSVDLIWGRCLGCWKNP